MNESSEANALPGVVLVFHSDADLRSVVSVYLRQCGFVVLEASRRNTALRLIKFHPKVSVAFVDTSANAALKGFRLARWIRQNRPQTKVVLVSSVSQLLEETAHLSETASLLPAPFQRDELERRLRLATPKEAHTSYTNRQNS